MFDESPSTWQQADHKLERNEAGHTVTLVRLGTDLPAQPQEALPLTVGGQPKSLADTQPSARLEPHREDISSSVTAQRFGHSLRPITDMGIPVLVVTHTPKGTVEGMSVASSPIGGRAIAASSP